MEIYPNIWFLIESVEPAVLVQFLKPCQEDYAPQPYFLSTKTKISFLANGGKFELVSPFHFSHFSSYLKSPEYQIPFLILPKISIIPNVLKEYSVFLFLL